MAKTVKRPGLLWFQGTVGIDKGGTGGATAAEALVNLGYIPSSSLGKADGPIPLVGGLIPAEYLPGADGYIPTVLGAPRQFAASTRTLTITNYDSWVTYDVTALHGTVGGIITAGSDTGSFSYTAPTEVPVGGKDSITINGVNFDIEILTPRLGKPSVLSPVENFSGMLSDIGSFTSSNYAPGSTEMLGSITVAGNIGSFVCPTGTDKIRVMNRSNVTATVSQGGVVKTIAPASELEWAGNGTWGYGVSGHVQVEFLRGLNPHASTDWQISTASDFSTVMYQSLTDTINKLSWANPIQQGGIYYVRVRHRDNKGNVSAWSDTRRIVPTGLPTRQTSYQTNWTSLWYTNWITNTPTPTTLTSMQTAYNTSVNTNYYSQLATSAATTYEHNTSMSTTKTWSTVYQYSTVSGGGNHYTWVENDPQKDGASYSRLTYATSYRLTDGIRNTTGAALTSWATTGGYLNTEYALSTSATTSYPQSTNYVRQTAVLLTSWTTGTGDEGTSNAHSTGLYSNINTSYLVNTTVQAVTSWATTGIRSTASSTMVNTVYPFSTSALTLVPWSTFYSHQTSALYTKRWTDYWNGDNQNIRLTDVYSYWNTVYPVNTSGQLLTAWETSGIRATETQITYNTSWNTDYVASRNTSWQTVGVTEWATGMLPTTSQTSIQTSFNTSTNTAYSDATATSISTLVSTVGNTEYAFATTAMTLTPWSTTYSRQTLGLTTVVTSGYGQQGNGCRYTEDYTYLYTSYPVNTSGSLLTAWSTVGIRATTYIVSANTSWNTNYSGVRGTSWLTSGVTSWSTTDDYQQNTSLQTSQNTSVLTEKSTLI